MPANQCKNFTFTHNNPVHPDDKDNLLACPEFKFIEFALEVGDKKTPHYQGFVHMKKKMTFKKVNSIFKGCISAEVHLEMQKGSNKQNSRYIAKDPIDGPWTNGEPNAQGKRTDLLKIQEEIKNGATLEDLYDDHFQLTCQYRQAFKEYIGMKSEKRSWITDVHIRWGETDTGKSRYVHELFPKCYVYPGYKDAIWFDKYEGEDVVLIDDFADDMFPCSYLLKLLDRYKMWVPIKGGWTNWKPKIIYITSNHDPEGWYGQLPDALRRRFTTCKQIIKKQTIT